MKKAFTMIEIIFVIIVVAILASIALPKMLLIRNDAIVSKELANIKILKDDLVLYYAKHSKLPDNLTNIDTFTKISNITWSNAFTLSFNFVNETCITLILDNTNSNLTISPNLNPTPLCKTLQFALSKSALLNLDNNIIKEKTITLGGGSIYDVSDVK